MLKFLKSLFGSKPVSERHPLDAVTTPTVSAPYKVPEPVATTPIPLVVETAPVQVEVVKTTEETTPKPKAVAKPKAPAKPKALKPVAEKATAKPKAPKKPKISIAK